MERSISEEEREIKEIIRRAVRTPDKKGVFRRETLNRMIALIHSPHPSIKILAAANIQLFVNDFPDLEEAAINAVYDLCEDQSSKVRMEGYATIIQVSRADSKWIKRNADVLVQLLQSDEPDEVVVVKKALIEHMDMDPKVTLSVLCDQILPADESGNDEEQAMRDRLRSLVLSFLTGEAKRSILRHAKVGSDAEAIVMEALTEAIPRLNFTEIQTIVKDLLLSLEGYSPRSRGASLLSAIIRRASHNLRQDLQSRTASLDTTQPLLELCNHLVAGKHVSTSIDLLRFYCSSLTSRLTLQQLLPDVRCWIICNMADLLLVSRDNATQDSDFDLTALRKQIVDACPFLLQILWDAGLNRDRVSIASVILLRLCLQRKNESGGTLPANLLNALETMSSKIQEISPAQRSKEVVELIRSLYPSPSNNELKSGDHQKVISAAENTVTMQHPPGSKQLGSSRYRTTTNVGSEPPQDTSDARLSRMNPPTLTFRGAAAHGKHPLQLEGNLRPLKRRKDDQVEQMTPSASSLLSRMSSSVVNAMVSNNARNDAAVETPQGGPPPGGWSIKGAATASLNTSSKGTRTVRQEPVYSLLDRLDDSNSPSSVRGVMDVGERRRKKGKLM